MCLRICQFMYMRILNHHIGYNFIFIVFYYVTFVSSFQPVMNFLDPHSVSHRLGSHSLHALTPVTNENVKQERAKDRPLR